MCLVMWPSAIKAQAECPGGITHRTDSKKEDWQKGKYVDLTSTAQHQVGDIAQLKQNASWGEGGVRDRWNNVQHGVIQQIVTAMPTCEMRVQGGNVVVVHWDGAPQQPPREGMSHPCVLRQIFQSQCRASLP